MVHPSLAQDSSERAPQAIERPMSAYRGIPYRATAVQPDLRLVGASADDNASDSPASTSAQSAVLPDREEVSDMIREVPFIGY